MSADEDFLILRLENVARRRDYRYNDAREDPRDGEADRKWIDFFNLKDRRRVHPASQVTYASSRDN